MFLLDDDHLILQDGQMWTKMHSPVAPRSALCAQEAKMKIFVQKPKELHFPTYELLFVCLILASGTQRDDHQKYVILQDGQMWAKMHSLLRPALCFMYRRPR